MFQTFIVLAIAVGCLGPTQGTCNGALGKRIGSWEASLVNGVVGLVIMLIISLFTGNTANILGAFQAPWWAIVVGGALGCVSVFTSSVCIPKIGASLTTTASLLSQLAFGIICDQFGLLGMNVNPVDAYRAIGVLILFAGVYVSFGGKTAAASDSSDVNKLPYILLAVFTGITGAIYPLINVVLSAAVGTSIETTVVVFASGSVCFLLINLVKNKGLGGMKNIRTGTKWWHFLGGLMGATTSYFQLFSLPILGSVVNSVSLVIGRLLMAMTFDSTGIMEVPKAKVSTRRIIGFILIVISIFITNAKGLFGL